MAQAPEGVTVVLGAQWGDEGKGKLVDILAQEADVCARCAGGNNAGHTIVVKNAKGEKTTYAFNLLPSGLVNEKCTAFIGSGVVVHIPSLFNELDTLERKGLKCADRLFISDRAHLVLGFHQIVDGLKEIELGGSSIGTTKKGIGPAYSSKASRSGLRVHHLYDPSFPAKFRKLVEGRFKRYGHFEFDTEGEIEMYLAFADRLRPHIVDGVQFMHKALTSGKRVLVEGANALMLDIDYGTYPYVTSSATSIGGVCTGLGIPPQAIKKVVGVIKAYTTRVGGGPFPTEDLGSIGETLQEVGAEFGVVTGRRRRCGWLDLVVMKYSTIVNGYTSLNLTKLDVLDGFEQIKVAVGYKIDGAEIEGFPADLERLAQVEVVYETLPGWKSDISKCTTFDSLPSQAQSYVRFIENYLGVKIQYIGVGPSRDSSIQLF
ncbi:putative adenylosuccinate synthase [Kockovaella imperatae]|uniref:Adenylosuccinate synthetase n=1 Tax=Kockovaella imperatae TaxID=4999 RepID=A0A1Y1ULF7_9TREE|nr:putative adenylosuccinate synthase [Kockovaella imperatae]ORX38344.1 putative adenylosuccinate synthase [Kockovaella imperatae]